MCGLVGVAGNLTDPDRQCFHDLLRVDAIRGEDGTGVASVMRNTPGEVELVKGPGGPEMLFDRKSYWNAIGKDRFLMMGHNRYKTMGDSSAKNTHPFNFDHIVGAHNGTLTQPSKNRMRNSHRFATDSEALYDNLNEEGLDETIKKMDGAWALVWYNKDEHSLNFLRNKERPLYYCYDNTETTIYWASEVAMLYLCLNHNKIGFSAKKVHCLSEDTHQKWIIPDKPGKTFSKPERRPMKSPGFFPTSGVVVGGPPTTQQRNYHGQVILLRGTRRFSGHGGVATSVDSSTAYNKHMQTAIHGYLDPIENKWKSFDENKINPATPLDKTELAKLPDGCTVLHSYPPNDMSYQQCPRDPQQLKYYIGYANGERIYKDDFELMALQGCACCNASVVFGEPVKLLKDGSFICFPCYNSNVDNCKETLKDFL